MFFDKFIVFFVLVYTIYIYIVYILSSYIQLLQLMVFSRSHLHVATHSIPDIIYTCVFGFIKD